MNAERKMVDQSIYPEVNFEVDIPLNYEMDSSQMMRKIIDHALSQLNRISETSDNGSRPENVAPMFTYSRSEAVEERHQKFLLQTVYGAGGARTRKATIVEENDAAERVANELSLNRHPVSQLLEQLKEKYGSHIGHVAMSDVYISVIKHTAYSRYRHALNKQVEDWQPAAPEITKKSSGISMKGRLKPLYDRPKKAEEVEQPVATGRKRRSKSKITPLKQKFRQNSNPKAQKYSGKIGMVMRKKIAFNQKLPRPGHQRTPRVVAL